jgi:hypothetical protein
MADPWPVWLRVGFRFVVSFFAFTTLYLAIGHLSVLLPFLGPGADAVFAPYEWGVTSLFGRVTYATTHGFMAYLTTALAAATIGAIVWSLIDRRRRSYPVAHGVLRIYLRYLLAAVALGYGANKVIPVQFAPPSLIALLTPLGEFTRMRLLWHFMGTSTAYIVFTGLVEVVGGLLLFSRRTTPAGALILAAAFTNVAVLNFGYEVGVQLNSTIYALMALVLLAPDARRIVTAFLSDRPIAAGSRSLPPWISRSVKAATIVLLVAGNFRGAYRTYVESSVLPALYGMYDVEDFERDGVRVPPGDRSRWLRLVIAERARAAIQSGADGHLDLYDVTADPQGGVLTLTGRGKGNPVSTFHYRRVAEDLIEIAGRVDDHDVRARLKAIDVTRFPLRRPRGAVE